MKMDMKNLLKYTAFAAVLLLSAPSCDYLDKREETDGLSIEEVFGNANNYELYVEWMIQNPILQYLQNYYLQMKQVISYKKQSLV